MGKVLERFWGFSQPRKGGLSGGMKILDLGALRGCCHSLPDLRQGGDVRYTMADLSAFSLFFLQSPSFPASSGGGTGAVELPDAVRPGADPQRQSYPGAAGPGQPRPLSSGLHRGGGRTGGGLEAFRLPIKLPRSTGSIATHFQSHLELLIAQTLSASSRMQKDKLKTAAAVR